MADARHQITEASYKKYLRREKFLYIKPSIPLATENACELKFTSNISPQSNDIWDQHPTWISANMQSTKQLRTGGKIYPDKYTVLHSTPQPASETSDNATQRIIFGVPNASHTPALIFLAFFLQLRASSLEQRFWYRHFNFPTVVAESSELAALTSLYLPSTFLPLIVFSIQFLMLH